MTHWKTIKGYQVSDTGKVKSKDGKTILKTVVNNSGYLLTGLHIDGKRKMVPIHKLVAMAFLKNPKNLSDVDHIDGNKNNNSKKNLRWCTHKDNCQKKRAYTKRRIVQYTLDGFFVDFFDNLQQASKRMNITSQGIHACCEGFQKTCCGFRWGYYKGAEQVCLWT